MSKGFLAILAVAASALLLAERAEAQRADSVYVWTPRGVEFSFDHVLSIYEWHSAFDYTSYAVSLWQRRLSILDPITDIHLKLNSRFLPQDSLTTTDATGWVTAVQPISAAGAALRFSPFATFFGSSFVTSPRPGSLSARLITNQGSGFGILGLQALSADGYFLSGAAGLARQTQSPFGSALPSDAPLLSATGLMLTSQDSVASHAVAEGVMAAAHMQLDERFFAQRDQRFSNDSLRFSLVSGLNDSHAAQNAAFVQLGLLRRDFFFSPDTVTSVKQERTEYSLDLSDSLIYPIIEDYFRAHLAVEFAPGEITRTSDLASSSYASSSFSAFTTLMAPSDISSSRLMTQAALTLGEETPTPQRFSGDARIRYEERSESVQLLSSDIPLSDQSVLSKLNETLNEASYASRVTTADATLRYLPSLRDEANLYGIARILQYDTPSETNTDDHDDLLTAIALRYRHQFSTTLGWNASLKAASDHLVYLKSDRSAENAVTRSLIFGSSATYLHDALFATAGGEVFANYTIFDYVNQIPELSAIGNYVVRGLTASDSVAVPLTHIASNLAWIEQGIAVRISERGTFNDSAFSERRDTRVIETTASLFVTLASPYEMDMPWTVRLGARAFILSRSGRNPLVSPLTAPFDELERQTRIGPAMTLSLGRPFGVGPSLRGSIWYAFLTSQTFDEPTYSRSTQIESYLTASWSF